MNRREFLHRATFLSTSGLLFLNGNAWAARALGEAQSRKRLVAVFLRGAVDGLNVVVPYMTAPTSVPDRPSPLRDRTKPEVR